jgi:integrase
MTMVRYNPKNERIKKLYFRFLKEADQKSDATVDAVRKAIGRFEEYTNFKDFATFNVEQAIGFKKRLAKTHGARSNEQMAVSTLLATLRALKEFLRWLSCQPGYKAKLKATDSNYLNLSENEIRAAKEPRFKTFPTLEQVRAAFLAMPSVTDIERRDRALIAMTILTGARDSALASLRLKHVDLERKLVIQDPREVRTKRRKRVDSYFFPVGEDFEAAVIDWVRYLRAEKLYGVDDPVFPKTRTSPDAEGAFAGNEIEPLFWKQTSPIRRIFRDTFSRVDLPYIRPHSFRDTLAQYGERYTPNIEAYKAWSLNLGHEHVGTTLSSYGTMSSHRQSELVRCVSGASSLEDEAENRELFGKFIQLVRSGAARQPSDPPPSPKSRVL